MGTKVKNEGSKLKNVEDGHRGEAQHEDGVDADLALHKDWVLPCLGIT
jgi:hypothetical protein